MDVKWLEACIDEDERRIGTNEHDSGQCDYLGGIHLELGHALAEVAFKRKMLAAHAEKWALYRTFEEQGHVANMSAGRATAMSGVLRELAEIYKDRPGYREATKEASAS